MLLVNEFHDYFSYLYISHVAGADAVEGGKCARVVEKLLVAPCYSSSLCVCVRVCFEERMSVAGEIGCDIQVRLAAHD